MMKELTKKFAAAIIAKDNAKLQEAFQELQQSTASMEVEAKAIEAHIQSLQTKIIQYHDKDNDTHQYGPIISTLNAAIRTVRAQIRTTILNIFNDFISREYNPPYEGRTLVTLATEVWPDAIPHLVKAGAGIDQKDSHQDTALELATFKGDTATISILLANGADPNCTWHSQLFDNPELSDEKIEEILKIFYLLKGNAEHKHNSESNIKTINISITGMALGVAIRKNKLSAIKFLCAQFTDQQLSNLLFFLQKINGKRDDDALPIFQYILMLNVTDDEKEKLLKVIYERPNVKMVIPNYKAKDKCKSLLFEAVKKGHVKAVRYVCTKLIPETFGDKQKPSIFWGKSDFTEILVLLDDPVLMLTLGKYYNLNADTYCENIVPKILSILCGAKSLAMIRVLLELGANPFSGLSSAFKYYADKYCKSEDDNDTFERIKIMLEHALSFLQESLYVLNYDDDTNPLQEQLKNILKKQAIPSRLVKIIIPAIAKLDELPRLIGREYSGEIQAEQTKRKEQDKAKNARIEKLKNKLEQFAKLNQGEIKDLQSKVDNASEFRDPQKSYDLSALANYIFKKAVEKQSIEDFAKRWVCLITIIKALQEDYPDILELIAALQSIVSKFGRDSECVNILQLLVRYSHNYIDRDGLVKMKNYCEKYLTWLKEQHKLLFDILQSWIQKNIFDRQPVLVAAAAQQTFSPDPEPSGYHSHPVQSLGGALGNAGLELHELKTNKDGFTSQQQSPATFKGPG